MSNFNSSINRLREQLNNSKNAVSLKKPLKKNIDAVILKNVEEIKSNVKKLSKKPFKKTQMKKLSVNNAKALKKKIMKKVSEKKGLIKVSPVKNNLIQVDKEQSSTVLNILYIILLLSVLCLAIYLCYLLYQSYIERQNTNIIVDKIKKAPKPVDIEAPEKEGVSIKVEEGGDITENKYLSKYGSEEVKDILPNQYEKQFFLLNSGNEKDCSYKNIDNGNSKKYYENVKEYEKKKNRKDNVNKIKVIDYEREKLNEYIKEQNDYVRRLNLKVREINSGILDTDDEIRLKVVRNYERILANKVNRYRYD